MSSLHAFTVAVELAERQRDVAREQLKNVQGACHAAQAQLQQLDGYAVETQGRFGASEGRTLQPLVLQHHYQFMGRLEHAIALQTRVVGSQQQRVEQARQALVQAELRLASLRKVLQRRQDEQARAQQRREQKQTDERAALRLGAAAALSRDMEESA
ncbi:flagellar FliJ protein [Oryzisolibacter propanilivorax]|uniref:Flagellar FliJ protein n=1 Tax=Oryzisolibacter propanilivorax TaxID=1527607 RepID=A0A1G9V425_9BURK|nr:flagellar export protein FliJ [Oryzisolibacter propanilivorax]SDM66796.1 flagellar FliJ protein [Oryzisolibacter propanilivorax]